MPYAFKTIGETAASGEDGYANLSGYTLAFLSAAKSPGTADSNGGGQAWFNMAYIGSLDGSVATCNGEANSGLFSSLLSATNYGFDIPTSSTILGVVVSITRRANTVGDTYVVDSSVRLIKGGAVAGNDKASVNQWGSGMGTATYGASNDLWGLTLTPADVNASNFGVGLVIDLEDINGSIPRGYVDYIGVTVYYQGPTWPPTTGGSGVDGATLTASRSWDGSNFLSQTVLFRFDTSVLPVSKLLGGYISLSLSGITQTDANMSNLRISAYDATNWPIDAADVTDSNAGSVFSGVISGFINGGINIYLPDVSILNGSGYTGFRMNISRPSFFGSYTPTGINAVTIDGRTGTVPPTLTVWYPGYLNGVNGVDTGYIGEIMGVPAYQVDKYKGV